MFGPRAAASAHDVDAIFGDELLVIVRQLLRLQLVHRMTALVLRQTGIGQHRDRLRRIQSKVADRVVHFLRAGSAVHADHSHVEHLQRGQRGANFSTQQHRAAGIERDLHLYRNVLARLLQRIKDADQPGLGLQDVLARFEQQHVDAAFDQPQRLLGVAGGHLIERDVAERGQLARRPHRTRNKAFASLGRIVVGNAAREFRRRSIERPHLVQHVVLDHVHRAGVERVGLDHVASHFVKRRMDVADDVGPAQHQHFVVAFLAPKIVDTGLRSWILVPIAPSKITTRSRTALR